MQTVTGPGSRRSQVTDLSCSNCEFSLDSTMGLRRSMKNLRATQLRSLPGHSVPFGAALTTGTATLGPGSTHRTTETTVGA